MFPPQSSLEALLFPFTAWRSRVGNVYGCNQNKYIQAIFIAFYLVKRLLYFLSLHYFFLWFVFSIVMNTWKQYFSLYLVKSQLYFLSHHNFPLVMIISIVISIALSSFDSRLVNILAYLAALTSNNTPAATPAAIVMMKCSRASHSYHSDGTLPRLW